MKTARGGRTPASDCADGGRTDLSNAALLCERHHTTVHTRRYAGRLVEDDTGHESSETSPSGHTTGSSQARQPGNPRDLAPHPAHRSGGPDLRQRGRR